MAGDTEKIPGTQSYAAPELILSGPDYLAAASDIWAVGCIGYELFTGLKLFDSVEAIEAYIQTENLLPAQMNRIMQDPDIFQVLRGCLQIDPNERYSIWTLMDRIQQVRQRLIESNAKENP